MVNKSFVLTEYSICPKNGNSLSFSVKTFDLMIKALIFNEPILTFYWHLSFLYITTRWCSIHIIQEGFSERSFTSLNSISLDVSDDQRQCGSSWFNTLLWCGRLNIIKRENVFVLKNILSCAFETYTLFLYIPSCQN